METSSVMGLDSVLLSLAIASIQSDHALSTAGLSAFGDDGGMVYV